MEKRSRWHGVGKGRGGRVCGAVLLVALTAVALACGDRPAGPNANQFDLTGVVVRVEGDKIVLAHDAIEGFMEAMVMPFETRDDWALDVVTPGDRVQATLVVDEGRAWIEGLVVTQAADGHDGQTPPTPEAVLEGTEVPDYALVNQDGQSVSLHQYRGRAVLLTFIYTKCPIPDFCPLMSRNFMSIDQQLRRDEPELAARTQLLSLSFDSSYDSPEVMRRYGTQYRPDGDFEGWEFIAATEGQVGPAAKFFGLAYWEDTGQWIHNLRTILIGPDGTVAKVYLGNDWTPAQVLADLQALEWPAAALSE